MIFLPQKLIFFKNFNFLSAFYFLSMSDLKRLKAAARGRRTRTIGPVNKRMNNFIGPMNIPSNKRLVVKETGYVDSAVTLDFLCYDGVVNVYHCSVIPEGSSVNQRVGKKVALKSIQIRGEFRSASSCVHNHCSALLVYDRRPTATLPAPTDILKNANSYAMNNDNNSGRFQIIRRWNQMVMGVPGINPKGAHVFSEFVDLKGRKLIFKNTATTGAYNTVEEGALLMMCVGSAPTAATGGSWQIGYRLRYMDM